MREVKLKKKKKRKRMYKAPPRFELGISCLLDRRFNQLSHGAKLADIKHIVGLKCTIWGKVLEEVKKKKNWDRPTWGSNPRP